MNNIEFEVEPERFLFDIFVEFINEGENTQTLLRNVKQYLINNPNLDLNKRYNPFRTDGFKITDVFIQYTPRNYGTYPEHDISILEMMTPEGTIWLNDQDRNKKNFFGLLKVLFDHGLTSIYHRHLNSNVPYLIFMALISPIHDTSVFNNIHQRNENVLEKFLEFFIEQKVKRENKTFIDTLLNDVYEGNERLIRIDTSLHHIKNFVMERGYTILHTLIECGYEHYHYIIDILFDRNPILIDYNKNNPFYLALEVYKREMNVRWFGILLNPYLELIGKGLNINNYYFDEDLTTFMKLLEVYIAERVNIFKNELLEHIVIIMKKERLKPTRKHKISPLLFVLTSDEEDLKYFIEFYDKKNNYDPNSRLNRYINFTNTVELFDLFMEYRENDLFETSTHNLSAFLYVLNLNLNDIKNDDYNKAIEIFKRSIHNVDRSIATNFFINYYIIKEKQIRIDFTNHLVDGIYLNDKQIVKNLVQYQLVDFKDSQLDMGTTLKYKNMKYEKFVIKREQELNEKIENNLPLLNSLIQIGIPVFKLLGNDALIFLIRYLNRKTYGLLYRVIEQDQEKIYEPIFIHEMPLKMYIQSVISNYQKKVEHLEHEMSKSKNAYRWSPLRPQLSRIRNILFQLEFLFKKRYMTEFEDYLYHYHFEYKQIKDALIQLFKPISKKNKSELFEDRLVIKFMTENGIEPEWAVEDENEYEFQRKYRNKPPPFPFIVINQWKGKDYTFLWYPDELSDEQRKLIFKTLKELVKEDVRMREMEDYYLTGEEMGRRFEDL